jgi:type I restriction enzyme S subunit
MADQSRPDNTGQTTTIGKAFKVVGGGTPSTTVDEYWNGEIPWITSADIDDQLRVTPRKKITRKAIENSATNLVPAGAVIVVTRVGLGKVAVAPCDLCFSQDCQALIIDQAEHDPEYIALQLKGAVGIFKHIGRGTTINGVTKKQLLDLAISLPPLSEQHRVVEKIEKQFTRQEAGVSALKRLKANLKRYRASVLKDACEGSLVPTEAELARQEGRTYEPADVLLQRILTKRSTKAVAKSLQGTKGRDTIPTTNNLLETTNHLNLPEGWRWASLDQICHKITDGEHLSPKTTDVGIKLLSAKDVRENGVIISDPKFISETDAAQFRKRCDPEKNDVLIVSRGATIGRTTIVQTDEMFCLMGSVILLKVMPPLCGAFLAYCLRSQQSQSRLGIISGSTAQQAIYLRDIKPFVMPLPPLAEQYRIVAEVERRLSVIDELESVVAANLKRAERMRQAILHKAFTGQLV